MLNLGSYPNSTGETRTFVYFPETNVIWTYYGSTPVNFMSSHDATKSLEFWRKHNYYPELCTKLESLTTAR